MVNVRSSSAGSRTKTRPRQRAYRKADAMRPIIAPMPWAFDGGWKTRYRTLAHVRGYTCVDPYLLP